MAHPIEDEIFGPRATRRELLDAGWERPGAWLKRLGIRPRTLLWLRASNLLASHVYDATRFFLCRVYRADAPLEAIRAAARDREGPPDLTPVKRTYRTILDAAEIAYEEGSRSVTYGYKDYTQPALLVPHWAAPLVELTPPRRAFHRDDKRPAWQKRRLYRIAALRWAAADTEKQEALEALVLSGAKQAQAAIERLIGAHIVIDPDAPYEFARRGERTCEARRRRSHAK